ncbi:MAG: ATP--guanido phosphotransferase, partial [Clostridiales bacterium]|nr:ATP--guanido phosphotransferase [Clostridiales bacterium]
SVMMHLPSLSITGFIKNIYEACGKLGVAIRGLYGENSEAAGNIYQVSNQITLGMTEEEIINSVKSISLQIMEQESALRQELYKKNSYRFEDMVFRALGTLESARILTSEECLKLLSDVRLGVDMGLIKGLASADLNEITVKTQPANLQKMAGRTLSNEERDVRRAEYIRNVIAKA